MGTTITDTIEMKRMRWHGHVYHMNEELAIHDVTHVTLQTAYEDSIINIFIISNLINLQSNN